MRSEIYNKAIKEMFKTIPLMNIKSLSPKQKFQKLMTEICGGWYMGKIDKVIPPLKRPKPSEKSQDKEDEIKRKLYEANKW